MLFNNSESISNSIFELIHSDVWEPFPVASIGGSRYFVFLLMIILVIVGSFL